MVINTTRRFGQLNYCINCSTTNVKSKATAELESEMFLAGLKDTSRAVCLIRCNTVIQLTNRRQLWLCLRAELRQILSQPEDGKAKNSIVSVVPYGAGGSHPGHVVLAASGYSRIGMIKSMARDHLNDGVRINAIAPAVSDSKEDQDANSETLHSHMQIPGRIIKIQEIANAAVFMASELSSGINGVVLPVDAGWSMVHN